MYQELNLCCTRACLKIHSWHLHAPLRGIFVPNSLNAAHYAAFIWPKSPTKRNAHLAESIFQTRSSEISLILAKSKGIVYNEHRKSTHSKADAPKSSYLPLNERRLSCGSDRRGIIFFTCSSYLCRERQATPQSSCQRTSAKPIFL
ncbi:DUF6783 domain-containing protein [Otoolea muris]|uniref:DUF6783 domain-containing protein n=1 Tax=Otoolea muris TaxID=2941515 RepID=UPI003A7F60A7